MGFIPAIFTFDLLTIKTDVVIDFTTFWSWMARRWLRLSCVMSIDVLCALASTVNWIEQNFLTLTTTPNQSKKPSIQRKKSTSMRRVRPILGTRMR
jgi:hypothetical protein